MKSRKRETFEPVTLGHIRGHGCRDRWLTWSALLFGVVIPIAFLVFAWFTIK